MYTVDMFVAAITSGFEWIQYIFAVWFAEPEMVPTVCHACGLDYADYGYGCPSCRAF